MPSYDEDLPTQQEEFLLKQLEQNHDEHQRLQTIVEVERPHSQPNHCCIDRFVFVSVEESVGRIETIKKCFLSFFWT